MANILRFGPDTSEVEVPDEQTVAAEEETELDLIDKYQNEKRSVRAAVNLAIAGVPYPEIARILQYRTARSAQAAVEAGLANMFPTDAAATLRQKMSAQLDGMLRADYPAAKDPGHVNHFQAQKTVLDIMTRQARLAGIDAPQVMAVVNPDAQEMDAIIMKFVRDHDQAEDDEADILALTETEGGVFAEEVENEDG